MPNSTIPHREDELINAQGVGVRQLPLHPSVDPARRPWEETDLSGDVPGGICCQRAVGRRCYGHDRRNWFRREGVWVNVSPEDRSPNDPEPTPVGDGVPVWDLVIADMRERDATGAEKYGTRLRCHNGRRPLVDLYQELLDAIVYTRQEIEERRGSGVVWIVLRHGDLHAVEATEREADDVRDDLISAGPIDDVDEDEYEVQRWVIGHRDGNNSGDDP